MSIQKLAPTATTGIVTGFDSVDVTRIDEDVDTDDGLNWNMNPSPTNTAGAIFLLPTPSVALVGGPIQKFRCRVSCNLPAGTEEDSAQCLVNLYENGVPLSADNLRVAREHDWRSTTQFALTSAPQVFTFFWDSRSLTDPTGAGVEVGINLGRGSTPAGAVIALHSIGWLAETDDNFYPPNDGRHHKGLRTRLCSRCGFPYREDELVYRNGVLVCTIAGGKSSPCFDEPGYKEDVYESPLDLGPKPDSGQPPWPY